MKEKRRQLLEERWREVAERMEGCVPYENRRPVRVRAAEEGKSLFEILEGRFPGKLSRGEWEEVFAGGLLQTERGEVVGDGDLRPVAGARFVRAMRDWVEPAVGVDLWVVYEDEVLLVVDKPAPLPIHEGGRFYKNTLMWIAQRAWPELAVRYCHRLDAETSGVLVLEKGLEGIERRFSVQKQFEEGEVEKEYLARVQGVPAWKECRMTYEVRAEGREWGKRQPAETWAEVLEEDGGTALLRVVPYTGRTHQIRVHLWEEGFPIVGDRLYLPGKVRGERTIAELGGERLGLRAWRIRFRHPVTGEGMEFEVGRELGIED